MTRLLQYTQKVSTGFLIFAISFILFGLVLEWIPLDQEAEYVEDRDLGWRFRPGFTILASEGAERINSQGWRGPERGYSGGEKKGIRIACLGDSCTFGVKIRRDEGTYPRRLENLLRKKRPEGDWEVFNFGVNGYGTFHGAGLMQEIVPEIQPEVAIAYFGWNDRTRIVGWFDHRERVRFNRSPWNRIAPVRLLFRLSDPWIANLRLSRRLRGTWGESFAKNGQTLEEVEENLETFVASCRRQGILPILVTSPWGTSDFKELVREFSEAGPEERNELIATRTYYAHNIFHYNQAVRAVAARSGARLVDLEARFLAIPRGQAESYFHSGDMMHPNPKGCRLIARLLVPAIQEAV